MVSKQKSKKLQSTPTGKGSSFDFDQVPKYVCGQSVRTQNVVSKGYHATIMTGIRRYLRKKWYGYIKFVKNDYMAKQLIGQAVDSREFMIPTGMTEQEFKATYQNKMYKAMNDLRHNGQSLARKNYLGSYQCFSYWSSLVDH